MPCRCEPMEPTERELELQRVCELLVYLYGKLGAVLPQWCHAATVYPYGKIERVDEATRMLCAACRELTPQQQDAFMYDGRNRMARQLADWFERHDQWDRKRMRQEANAALKAESQ